jgi:hypothetical protein
MQPVPVGTRIRVVRNDFQHEYAIGSIYTITRVDDDGTFKAADPNGIVGNWLRWEECEHALPVIWDHLAATLPEDIVRFLSCFDGIRSLTLQTEVVDRILAKLPDLHERVASLAATPDGNALIANNLPRPDSKDHG